MRRLLFVLVLAGLGCGGGDPSPKEACGDLVNVTCSKLYECLTEAERTAGGLPATEAGCVTQYEEQFGCANVTKDNACDPGETYHANKAGDCVDQIGNLSCAQVREGTNLEEQAPACNETCTVE